MSNRHCGGSAEAVPLVFTAAASAAASASARSLLVAMACHGPRRDVSQAGHCCSDLCDHAVTASNHLFQPLNLGAQLINLLVAICIAHDVFSPLRLV
jgi:hypothetical protein